MIKSRLHFEEPNYLQLAQALKKVVIIWRKNKPR